MSLDNIQLSPFLMQELYKNSLIDGDNSQPGTKSLKTDETLFLGKNQKNILVIVDEEELLYLSDENLNFLIGILGACKLSLSDIALLNFGKSRDINYKTLQEKFKPGIILFFGVDPAILEFPLQFPHYQLQSYNKQTYLSAPALDVLAADKQQKQQLWASLKKLFSI